MILSAVDMDMKSILFRIPDVVIDSDDHVNDVTTPNKFVAKHRHAICIGTVRCTYAHKMPGIRMTVEIWQRRYGVPRGLLIRLRRIAINRYIRTFGVR